MKLIDADELIIDYGFTWDDITPTHEEMVELIKRQPTIDAEPIRYGKWIKVSKNLSSCSLCGNCVMTERTSGMFYCQCCGAKMDEVKE